MICYINNVFWKTLPYLESPEKHGIDLESVSNGAKIMTTGDCPIQLNQHKVEERIRL
jgi:hypothetical protein